MTYYAQPLEVDQLASDVENFLTMHAKIPLLGTVPAGLKVVFGVVQAICSAVVLVVSTFFLTSKFAQNIWLHSSRHFLHGLSNMLAGAIQAIPFIGSLIILIPEIKRAGGSDSMVHYSNSRSNKFFGYKTLEDTSWERQDYDSRGLLIDPSDVNKKDGKVHAALFSI